MWLALASLAALYRPLPRAATADPPTRIAVRDRAGRLLRLAGDPTAESCARAPLMTEGSLPPLVVHATLAAEDRRFFSHPGVDPIGVARAAARNLRARRIVAGGSTLTQQLAGLVQPAPRTIGGKLLELGLALRLEAQLSKRAILAAYLNQAPYGNGCRGITAAADHYFARAPEQLSAAEAALLAALPQGPAVLDPRRNPGSARSRAHAILRRMRAAGALSRAELARALDDPLALADRPGAFASPHAVDWAITTLPEGCGSARLTIDRALDERLSDVLRESLAPYRMDPTPHGAIVVLDHTTGEVLAMVGSPNYEDPRGGQWNSALALRQPGSALKPFTYALAFAGGHTPADLVADIPTVFREPSGDYVPRNYSQTFHGPVRLREALASSYNVPAVRMLDEVGSSELLELLHAAGISTLREPASTYGLGLTLGVGEVTLLDLCRAYALFPRGGRAMGLRAVAEVRDRQGAVMRRPDAPGAGGPRRSGLEEALLPARAAFWVTDILADPEARIGGFGPHGPLEMPFVVAAKTGTSSDYRDAWTVGFDRRYVVGVWVGNLAGEPLPRMSASRAAAPLFRAAFYAVRSWEETALAPQDGAGSSDDDPPAVLATPPPDLVRRTVCVLSGGSPGPGCRERVSEWLPTDQALAPCEVHQVRAGGQVDVVLPGEYGPWLRRADRPGHRTSSESGPLAITSPRDGDRFFLAPDLPASVQTIRLRCAGGSGEAPVWAVDGVEVGLGREIRWTLAPGRHRITAQAQGEAPGGGLSVVTIVVEQAPVKGSSWTEVSSIESASHER
jgi:penicillin-binding protein 1C